MIGSSELRKEGRAKVLGKAIYTDDMAPRPLLHGLTLRSSVPFGILRGIRFGGGLPWEEFTMVGAGDIPGENRVASVAQDQPFLVELGGPIRHTQEPILLLAHEDLEMLERARRSITFDIDACDAGAGEVLKEIRIIKGDVEGAFAGAAHVIEGEYRTGAQEHAYLEPNGVMASVNEEGVSVWGSMQCPYYVHRAMMKLFDLPEDRVRVVQVETGGAFGGKEDYPSVIAGHAALLAWKSGRPVKLIYDREEDMAATTKRHPSRTRIKAGFDGDGRLLALDIDFELDAGAYATLSSVVLSRGAIHAGGVYRCPNTRIQAKAISSTKPPMGAFRGFGAPQSLFAIERHMDVCANRLGIAPSELRRRNFLRMGDVTATGQIISEALDLEALMDKSLADLQERTQDDPGPDALRGVGISTFMHGCGFTGSGEARLASVAGLEGLEDGQVRVLAASTEFGQGKDTVFAQIVANALQIPMEMVDVAQPDTSVVPDSGPTVASRSTMVVGRLLEDSAYGFKQALIQEGLLKEPYTPQQFQDAVRASHAKHGARRYYAQYHLPPHIHWDDAAYQGDAYPTFSWACYAARVAVDTVTWEVTVEDLVATQEVGKVINPTLAEGQIEGGVAQGIGWALMEEVQWRQSSMANNTLSNYAIPTIADLPRIKVNFVENPHPAGPGGAKGLGELPMDGPAPAILNAIQQALEGIPGLRLDEAPMTPERLLERVEEAYLFRWGRLDALDDFKITNDSGEARPTSPLIPAKKASKACLFCHRVNATRMLNDR